MCFLLFFLYIFLRTVLLSQSLSQKTTKCVWNFSKTAKSFVVKWLHCLPNTFLDDDALMQVMQPTVASKSTVGYSLINKEMSVKKTRKPASFSGENFLLGAAKNYRPFKDFLGVDSSGGFHSVKVVPKDLSQRAAYPAIQQTFLTLSPRMSWLGWVFTGSLLLYNYFGSILWKKLSKQKHFFVVLLKWPNSVSHNSLYLTYWLYTTSLHTG